MIWVRLSHLWIVDTFSFLDLLSVSIRGIETKDNHCLDTGIEGSIQKSWIETNKS